MCVQQVPIAESGYAILMRISAILQTYELIAEMRTRKICGYVLLKFALPKVLARSRFGSAGIQMIFLGDLDVGLISLSDLDPLMQITPDPNGSETGSG
jgi:hypothetical protein